MFGNDSNKSNWHAQRHKEPLDWCILTYSMVQSPSWEGNWFAARQEIPLISRNPKVHFRTHKRPPPIPILGQPNPVHIPTSHLLEIHPNIIHPSTPRSPQWSSSLRFTQQDPIHPHSSPIRAKFPCCCYWIVINSFVWIMNWKRCGRKRSWPELQLYASITYRFYHHSKYGKRTREHERSLEGGGGVCERHYAHNVK